MLIELLAMPEPNPHEAARMLLAKVMSTYPLAQSTLAMLYCCERGLQGTSRAECRSSRCGMVPPYVITRVFYKSGCLQKPR